MTYLETVENSYGMPDGTYQGKWYRYDVLVIAKGQSYNIRISKNQRTPGVPVTVTVVGNLIDLYLGYETYE